MNETLSLTVESRVRGQQDAQRLEQTLVRIDSVAKNAARSSSEFAQQQEISARAIALSAAALVSTEKALVAFKTGVVGIAKAYTEHTNAVEAVIDSFRVLRVALSPTVFTGVVVGAGIATEALVKLTYSAGKALESQAFVAAKTKQSLQDVQSLQSAAKATGNKPDVLVNAAESIAKRLEESSRARTALRDLGVDATDTFDRLRPGAAILQDVARKFDSIADPVERAQLAIGLFGEDGEKKLQVLNGRVADSITRFREFGIAISGEQQRQVLEFKRTLDEVGDSFRSVGDATKQFGEAIERNIVVRVAEAADVLRATLRDLKKAREDFEKSQPSTPIGNPNIGTFAGRRSPSPELQRQEREGFEELGLRAREIVPGSSIEGIRRGILLENQAARAAKDRASAIELVVKALDESTRKQIEERKATKSVVEASRDASKERLNDLTKKIEEDDKAKSLKGTVLNEIGTPRTPLPVEDRSRLLQQFQAESVKLKELQGRVDALTAAEKAQEAAEKALLKQKEELKEANLETAEIARRAAGFGASEVERIELERRASLQKVRDRINPGEEREKLLAERDKEFGILLGKAARKEALLIRTARNEFLALEAKEAGTSGFKLLEFFFGVPLKEQTEELKKQVEAQRQILDIGVAAQKDAITRRANQSIRIAELQAQPGFELAAVEKGFEARKRLAEELLQIELDRASKEEDLEKRRIDIAKARADFEKADADARLDREVRILELQKQRIEDLRQSAGQVFDSLLRGGAGLRDFVKGQGAVIGRTLFQNVAVEIGKGTTGRLALPGQGDPGSPNIFGRILRGTPFGLSPDLKVATDANTTATKENTFVLKALSLSASSGAASNPNSFAGLLAKGFSLEDIPKVIFGGVSPTSGIATFDKLSEAQNISRGTQNLTVFDKLTESQNSIRGTQNLTLFGANPGPVSPRISGLTRGVGIGGAVAAGTFGAIAGFGAGGAQGALTGVGSLSGAAGSILALSGTTGPAAPILAGVGLALGVVASLLGDPKKKRDEEINRNLERSRFAEPEGRTYETDVFGRSYDYNKRGEMRPIEIVNNWNIEAIDAKSILDRRHEIAEGVRQSIYENSPLNDAIRAVALPVG